MPTYDYACGACGHEFELEQRITEPPAKKCPKCGKAKASRQISAGNFILKGGGWYADGYGGSKKPAPKKESTPSTSSPSTSTSTSPSAPSSPTETKSETKSEKPKAAAAE